MENTNTTGPGGREPEAGHQLFAWIRSTELRRPQGGWAGGVAGSLAEQLGWDATLVRGLTVVALILFTSPTLLLYGLCWLLLPDHTGRIHAQAALRGSFAGGAIAAGIMTLIGAVNVFSPISLVGPVAILVNLVILGVVAWVLWLVFKHWRETDGETPQRPASAPRSTKQEDDGAAARSTESRRERSEATSGRPSWYPKEGPEEAGAQGPAPKSSVPTAEEMAEGRRLAEEREAKRRRRMVSFGLLLLLLPLAAAGVWAASLLGLGTTTGVLLALAGVVVLLSLMHIGSGLRGRRGRGGLLALCTALMMGVFLLIPAGTGGASHHAFGNYTTGSQEVNTAFANTRVDLRDLQFPEDAALDFAEGDSVPGPGDFDVTVQVNNGFGNATVILPDDVYWEIDPTIFLGNVGVRTEPLWEEYSGIAVNRRSGATPEQVAGTVELHLNSAFGNVTVYDETTYEQEELDGGEPVDMVEAPDGAMIEDGENRIQEER